MQTPAGGPANCAVVVRCTAASSHLDMQLRSERHTFTTRSLSDLLAQHGFAGPTRIDFMSLDIEGAALLALYAALCQATIALTHLPALVLVIEFGLAAFEGAWLCLVVHGKAGALKSPRLALVDRQVMARLVCREARRVK